MVGRTRQEEPAPKRQFEKLCARKSGRLAEVWNSRAALLRRGRGSVWSGLSRAPCVPTGLVAARPARCALQTAFNLREQPLRLALPVNVNAKHISPIAWPTVAHHNTPPPLLQRYKHSGTRWNAHLTGTSHCICTQALLPAPLHTCLVPYVPPPPALLPTYHILRVTHLRAPEQLPHAPCVAVRPRIVHQVVGVAAHEVVRRAVQQQLRAGAPYE